MQTYVPAIHDSLYVFIARELLKSIAVHSRHDVLTTLLTSVLSDQIDEEILENMISIELPGATSTTRKFDVLALSISYLSKREYRRADDYLSTLEAKSIEAADPQDGWLIPAKLCQAVLKLETNRANLRPQIKDVLQLLQVYPTWTIHALTTSMILMCITELGGIHTQQSWIDTVRATLNRIKEQISHADLLDRARAVQAEALFWQRQSDLERAAALTEQAYLLAQESFGPVHFYNTELLLQMASIFTSTRQFTTAAKNCQAAIECELAGAKDPLRLAKSYHALGRVEFSSEQDWRVSFNTLGVALRLYESASEFHHYDRLSVLHTMRNLLEGKDTGGELHRIVEKIDQLKVLISPKQED